MSRFLALAEKVLEDEVVLTARRIWDYAVSKEHAALDQQWGKAPAVALALILAAEAQRPGTEIHSSKGEPATYCLKYVYALTRPLEEVTKELYNDADKIAQAMPLSEVLKKAAVRAQKIAERAESRRAKGKVPIAAFDRNPFIIAAVRLRANYCCELCGEQGFRRPNGLGYVEVHHLVRLADGGPDIFENTAALCANCHRKIHFADDKHQRHIDLVTNLRQKGIAVLPA